MRHLVMTLAAVWLPVAANAQGPDPDKLILAARDSVWRAFFANDVAALNRLIPPAAATIEGGVERTWNNRNDIMANAKRFAGGKSRLVHLGFSNTDIARTGNSALVRANYILVFDNDGKRDTTRGRATELFVHDGTRWVNPYWQLEHNVRATRDIPLPDTLGANFPLADSASKQGSLTDYDALLGFWTFRFQTRAPDGSFNPSIRGHWSFEKKAGGSMIEDRWRGDNPTAPMGVSTYTYRTWHPELKRWQMLGTHSGGGEFALGLTWSDENNRYAIQHYGPAIMRIRYQSIDANHFLWRADRTTDGGKTWLLDAWTMEAWRVGK